VGLKGGRRLLGDVNGVGGTYRRVFATRILTVFQRVAVGVRNDSLYIWCVVVDGGNNVGGI
jgi:hypothetical protein